MERKIRAWDTKEKKMLDSQDFAASGLWIASSGNVYLHTSDGGMQFQRDRYILMYYSGLKDKNGKEIYEDDIIKSRCSDRLGVVKWNNAGFYRFESEAFATGISNFWDLEVIGDIHRDSKVLKEKNNE